MSIMTEKSIECNSSASDSPGSPIATFRDYAENIKEYLRTGSESQLPCTVRAMYLGAMSHGSAAMSHGLSCHVPRAWLPCSPDKFP